MNEHLLENVQPAGDGAGAISGSRPDTVVPDYAETGELSDEQKQVVDYISEGINEATRESKFEMWKTNIMANRPYFTQGNPALRGITAYVVGAGPSLEKNVHHLKTVSERGVIVAVEASLRFLLQNGVKPEFVLCIDGSDKMLPMIEGCDTDGITLVCTPSACPGLVAAWKGPRFFVTTPHQGLEKKYNSFHRTRVIKAKKDLKAGDDLFLDEEYEVSFGGLDQVIVTGGNVSTAAHDFSFRILGAQRVVVCGLDLSWRYESHHYAGHEHMPNTRARSAGPSMSHKDSNGNDVFTNFGLMQFKRFHEGMAKQMPGSFINATEGGILGIGEQGVRNPFVEFMTLEEAVAKFTPQNVRVSGPVSEPVLVNA